MNSVPVAQHPASVDAYIRHGWSLVPIPHGSKGPTTSGWNRKENRLHSQSDLLPGYGIGLAHAYSGTMALDIDDWARAEQELQKHQVSLNALYAAPDAVVIDSGRKGHGKLVYAMPFGLALPSKKLIDVHVDGTHFNYLDFRCSTANGMTVQDVLPPSIHPDTQQPYRWAGAGHWTRLPLIPMPLLDMWQSLLDVDKTRITTGEISASWEEIRSALECLSPDISRQEWVTVGMALHWAGTQTNQNAEALWLWNEWSKGSDSKYPGEREIQIQWNSFRPDKAASVTLGSLFHLARQHGWRKPEIDVSGLFPSTVPSSYQEVVDMVRPLPPVIPFDVLPQAFRDHAKNISDTMGCDPVVPLWGAMGAVCGAVDARSRLELMPGFRVPPVLWLMVIGKPAERKSPGSKPAIEPLELLEHEDRPHFTKRLLDWEVREAVYATAKKAMLEYAVSPDGMLDPSGAPSVPELPPQPVPLRIVIKDITSQKMVRMIADEPRGLLAHLDEMAGWFKRITDKTSGDDRSTWTVAYESSSYTMDRVGGGTIHAENFALSIVGNVQPAVFIEHVEALSRDGLLQRFLPAVTNSDSTRRGDPVSPEEHARRMMAWGNVLRTVFSLPAQVYRLSTGAYEVYREFQSWYDQYRRDEELLGTDDVFMGAFGKTEGLAGRVMLIWHVVESPFSPTVSEELARRVIRFIKEYTIPSLRYALSELGGFTGFDGWVRDYVLQYADQERLTLRQILQSARKQLNKMPPNRRPDTVMGAMVHLERAGWVARVDDGTKEHQQIIEWAINPAVKTAHAADRRKVIEAKQRRLDAIYEPSRVGKPRVRGWDTL